MNTVYFIDVILPIPLERQFTYRISQAEADFLQEGMRVAVPFGKSKIYTALVYRIHQSAPEVYEAKDNISRKKDREQKLFFLKYYLLLR